MQTDTSLHNHPITTIPPTSHVGYLLPVLGYGAMVELLPTQISIMALCPIALLIVLLQHREQGNSVQQNQLVGLAAGMIVLSAIFYLSNNDTGIGLSIVGLLGSLLALHTWVINVHLVHQTEETWFFREKGYLSDKYYTSLTIFKTPVYLFSLFIGTISGLMRWLESKLTNLQSILPSNLWKNFFQPVVFIGLFIALYSITNDNFARSIEVLFFPLFMLIDVYEYLIMYTNILDWITTLCISGIVFLPFSKLGVDLTLRDNIYNSTCNAEDDLLEDELNEINESKDTTEITQHNMQLSSMTPTLIALNLLLGWFHLVDGYGLLILDWSDAPTWSQAVHNSMSGAILGTISGLLLLNVKAIDWSNTDNVFWGKIWAYNNALFAGMTLFKCSAYLIGFGFTEARVMVITLMFGILSSFYVALKKIAEQKSRVWFMSRIIEIQYVCFILSALVISMF